MRSFPRATRRRIAATSVVAMTVGALALPVLDPAAIPWATANDHKDRLKKKQNAVKQQIKGVGADLEESSNQLAAATRTLVAANKVRDAALSRLVGARAALTRAEAALATAKAEDARMQAALAEARARLAQAKTDLATGREAAGVQREKVESTMISQAQGGDPRLLALAALMKSSSPEDLARQQELTETVVSHQAASYDDLRAAEVLLTVRAHQVKQATQQVADQAQQAADHLIVVQGLEQQAVVARDAVAASFTEAASARSRARTARIAAAKQKSHDLTVLKNLKQEEARIRAQILRGSRGDANRNVGSLDGLFQDPVAHTYITSPYGWRKHPIYGYWGLHNGDDFHAPCGTPEVAVDSGRVSDIYYSDVWGNRLFLDLGNINGHNYTAVYNHISKYKVKEGQVVSRGQTLALAGTTGWSTACHLHFTILRDGTAINPQSVL